VGTQRLVKLTIVVLCVLMCPLVTSPTIQLSLTLCLISKPVELTGLTKQLEYTAQMLSSYKHIDVRKISCRKTEKYNLFTHATTSCVS